ncbi:TetR/AcrR family transcriptional regulator [Anaerosporobacter faecicola]|uniref:TetR/AcrR family transcriptional regulator n=1 Tax=Anaerosporobacter faecicola TaxID=2718714 RepID=UPI0014389AC8|nr:TetR/AcrR family transcriptional regulator [Anaerosporobacter faecicola]
MTTKERILDESLKLFAIHGFDSVSVRTIAAAVGVRDSALYKHFPSKQAIFDEIVKQSMERFHQQYEKVDMQHIQPSDLPDMCLQMFDYQTKDPWIKCFRQMLILEQFKNPDMAKRYKEIFIDMPIYGQAEIFAQLMKGEIMKKGDPVVLSMELYAPFFLYHTVPEEEEELRSKLKKHVAYFMEAYLIP